MNTAVSFTTPNGEEMVVLSRAEYEALLKLEDRIEDLEDLLAVRAHQARVAAGQDESIPGEFVHRLIDRENPIRVWRDYRGLSGKDLAAAAGISAAYLSELETGKKEGSIAVYRAIAKALKRDLDDLFWGMDESATEGTGNGA